MRVISGTARGTKLYSLEGENTRPTLDRVKEALFNIIGNKIKGAVVLDLFSGSGAIGIEAASRDAKTVVICDHSKQAIEVIRKNIQKTRLEEKVKVYLSDFKTVLSKEKQFYDLIFLDPPYESNLIQESLIEIIEKDRLNENALIIIETDNKERIEKQIEELNLKIEILDCRKYGRAILMFLRKG